MLFKNIPSLKHVLLIGGTIALGLVITILTLNQIYGITIKPKTTIEFSKTAVMITRFDGRSGGSGVIISSRKNESKILTNKHVCQVVKTGGIVRNDEKKAVVKYYQESNLHDICLITVNSNFKINTVLATEEPDIYDDAIVSGFPRLLPNIITLGHFSQKEMINIMTGMRMCTPEEQQNPLTSTICGILNGFPIIKMYEAQVVSNTIQPGSSGSAVFNKNGEIAGLVFAGSGEFGYGHIVSYEYLITFFDVELPNLRQILPNEYTPNESLESKINWKSVCQKQYNDTKMLEVCDLASKSLLMRN